MTSPEPGEDRDLTALEEVERELADLERELRRTEGADEPADE